MEEALDAWTCTLEKEFPTRVTENKEEVQTGLYDTKDIYVCKHKIASPHRFVPVSPGYKLRIRQRKSI